MSDATVNPGDEGLLAGKLSAWQTLWRYIARALGLIDIKPSDMLKVGLVYLLSCAMIIYPVVMFVTAWQSNILLLSLPLFLMFLAGFFGLEVAHRWRE